MKALLSTVRIALIVCASFAVVTSAEAQTSSLVSLGGGGKLQYTPYANWGQTNAVNVVPDFSFAGYKGGGVPIPIVPIVETVNPVSGDAGATIQAAIDRVSALPRDAQGFRGAILLKSGRYEVNGSLFIKASGVVLRGEGQNIPGNGGTEIVATSTLQHDFIQIEGNESSAEPTSETILDTKLFPPARTWQEFSVLKGVAEELEGDKIITFHVTTDVNQYVNFSSREDFPENRPVLEITVRSQETGSDSIISLIPVADTYVQGGTSATLNKGADSSLAVKNAGVNSNVTREAYLKFVLPPVQDSVKSAILKLYAKKDLAADPTAIKNVNIMVAAIQFDGWDEMTLSYATRPVSSGSSSGRRISTSYVPTGASSFEVDSIAGFAVGDTIKVTRTPNVAWITALDMAQYGWIASEYVIAYERIITAINAKSMTVNIPLVQALEALYGGGEISKVSIAGRVSNIGVENMMISSYYASDTDESHGWSAITISKATDCWVRKVTARYFGYSCVGLYWAYNTTVEECAMLDPKSITTGSRKYSFYIDKGSFNLFQRCYTRGGRHDYVTGSRVAGPNVFVDCFATQTFADIGPHHRYATGVLFDNIRGGETRVQNRKAMGSGHGWAGAQTMFWNCQSDASEFKVESPVGAMNWGVGCLGLLQTGAGLWEQWGTRVTPRSLYFQQLQDRLGTSAVENVTMPLQRTGSIWSNLIQWAGIGDLSVSLGVGDGSGEIPFQSSLEQNYPNPFNPETVVRYRVAGTRSQKSEVSLRVYDLLGREVAVLVDGMKQPGRYSVMFNAASLPSGIYYYKFRTDNFQSVKPMVLLK